MKPMQPQTNSPNWHWAQLGYTVLSGPRRKIIRPDGSVVQIPESSNHHAAEIAAALAE